MQTTTIQGARVLLDNDRVTVSEVVLEPTQSIPMHSHGAYIIVAKTRSETRFSHRDGTSEIIRLEPGQILYREAETHSAENIGSSVDDTLVIDLK